MSSNVLLDRRIDIDELDCDFKPTESEFGYSSIPRPISRLAQTAATREPRKYSHQGSILVADTLDQVGMAYLLSGQVGHLHVPGYFDVKLCERLAESFRSDVFSEFRENYPHEITLESGEKVELPYGVERIGKTYNQIRGCSEDDPRLREYFRIKDLVEERVAAVCGGAHPLLAVMHHLGSQYEFGAEREKIYGKDAFMGVGRINSTGVHPISDEPHVDGAGPYERHFSVLMYLRTPSKGGELGVYEDTEFSGDEMRALPPVPEFKVNCEGETRDIIPVKAGDLGILNTRHPHFTTPFFDGTRIAISFFFGFNPGEPLKCYS